MRNTELEAEPEGSGLLEREREIAAGEGLLGELPAATAVAFVGPPGIGKTTLLRSLARRAGASGVRVLEARGAQFERGFPFAVAARLLAPALEPGPDAASAESTSDAVRIGLAAIDPARPREDFGATSEEALHAAVTGLQALILTVAAKGPVLLAVDDAQWVDPESLRWLDYLTRRLAGIPVVVALTAREVEPAAEQETLQELLSNPEVVVQRPRPLSRRAIGRMVENRFGRAPESEFAAACEEVSGGNPFLLEQLLDSVAAEHIEPVEAEVSGIRRLGPVRVAREVLGRVGHLGADCVSFAKASAVLGDDAEIGFAGPAAELDAAAAAEAADALVRAGVLTGHGQPQFVHPLVREAVYLDIPPGERASFHAVVAHLLDARGIAVDKVAGHLLQAEQIGEDWALARLRSAGRSALARGAPELAARYLERALQEAPDPADRAVVLCELGAAEATGWHADRAVDHFGAAVELLEDPVERSRTMRERGLTLFHLGRAEEAIGELERAAAELGVNDPGLTLRLEADLASMREMAPHPSHRSRANRRRLEALVQGLSDDDPAARVLRACLSHVRLRDCDPVDQVLPLAVQALEGAAWTEERGPGLIGLSSALMSLRSADALDELEATAIAGREEARVHGSAFLAALHSHSLSEVHLYRGDVAKAEASSRDLLGVCREQGFPMGVAMAATVLVEALVERGELAAARAQLEGAGLDGELPPPNGFAFLVLARARLHAAGGDQQAALDELEQASARFGAWGMKNPAVAGWRSQRALLMVRRDEPAEALRLAQEELRLAERFGAPRARGVALRACGVVAGGTEGLRMLEQAVELLSGPVSRLEHARALVELGAALRRSNARGEARRRLDEGLAVARQCGARALVERANTEIEKSGVRRRRAVAAGVAALTPSERRVAELAASGLSNKAIASELYVTRRTVETHLTQVYAKLGIESRRQLAARLGEK